MDPAPQIEMGEGINGLSRLLLEEASRNASTLDRHIKTISEAFIIPETVRQAAASVRAMGAASQQLQMAFGAANKLASISNDLLTPHRLMAEFQTHAEMIRGLQGTGVLQLQKQLGEATRL